MLQAAATFLVALAASAAVTLLYVALLFLIAAVARNRTVKMVLSIAVYVAWTAAMLPQLLLLETLGRWRPDVFLDSGLLSAFLPALLVVVAATMLIYGRRLRAAGYFADRVT